MRSTTTDHSKSSDWRVGAMSKPPLWKAMFDAYDTSQPAPADADDDWTDRHGYAAEIRAVRDWLGRCGTIPWGARVVMCRILTAEADRAERGEVE